MSFLTQKSILIGAMVILGVTIGFCLLRAFLGPRSTDRIMAVNMIGIKASLMIAILGVLFEQDYLLDICLLYALISFLAVVILSRTFISSYRRKTSKDEKEGEGFEND